MKKATRSVRRLLKKQYETKRHLQIDMVIKTVVSVWGGYMVLAFGESHRFLQLISDNGFLIQWAVNTLIAWLLFAIVGVGYVAVDERWPWSAWERRVPIHLGVCIVLPMMVAVGFATGYFAAYGVWIGDTSYADDIFFLTLFFVLFANAYQLIWKKVLLSRRLRQVLSRAMDRGLVFEIQAYVGNVSVALLPKNCAYFKREGKELVVITFDNKRYYLKEIASIKDLNDLLGAALFCKINHGCMVNKNAIAESIKTGPRNYKVLLVSPLEESLTVSQGCYSTYRDWMGL